MPEYLSPGVYVEEIEVGAKPIEGVSTSNLGIVGRTERGPGDVRLVTSWLEFQRLYGDPVDVTVSVMPLAVKGFFDNGGRRCFVARAVVRGAAAAQAQIGGLRVRALGPGKWGENLLVQTGEATLAGRNNNQFKVVVLYYRDGVPATFPGAFVDPAEPGAQTRPGYVAPTAIEAFDNVAPDADAQNYVARVLERSNLVRGEWIKDQPRDRPPVAATSFTLAGKLRLKRRTATERGALAAWIGPATDNDPSHFNLRVIHYAAGLPKDFDFAESDPANQATPPDDSILHEDLAPAEDTTNVPPKHQPETAINDDTAGLANATWIGGRERPENSSRWTVVRGPDGYDRLAGGSDEPAPVAGDTQAQTEAKAAALYLESYAGYEPEGDTLDGVELRYATGLRGLERVDDVTILAAPDEHAAGLAPVVREAVIQQCEQLKDRFAVFSVPIGQTNVTTIVQQHTSPTTNYAALYWPWIHVQHPVTAQRVLVPPVGHVAGIYARTDVERGVHKAPANAVVRGALDLEFAVTRGMQDILNPRGVNVIRDFRADRRDIRLWGARTMSADAIWKYVNVRRLFVYLEESIDEGTQWVVFEPNSEPLWDRVRRSIESFLLTVWRNGALMGTRPEQAFYVKCDRTTMTQDDIDNGRLICYIGIAPVKPAEFVVFRIHQWTLESGMAV